MSVVGSNRMKTMKNNSATAIHRFLREYETHENRNAVILAFLIALLGFSFIFQSSERTNSGFFNVLTYFFSILFFLYGLKDFIDHGLLISNAFLISFYFFLALNCFGFSLLQKPKTPIDVYFFFFGPLLFFLSLDILDKINFRVKRFTFSISYEFVCSCILIVFVMLYLYIFMTKGIRMFSNQLKSQQQSLYVVEGISGLIDVLAWLLLMLSFSTKRKKLKFLMISCPILFTLMNASRTLTMRMLVFMISYFLYARGKRAGSGKTLTRVMILGVIIIVAFGLWGNYREKTAGWMTVTIGDALQSTSNNSVFNWMYSYTAFNFDVIKQVVIEKTFPFRFQALFLPVIRLIYGSAAVGEYNKIVSEEVGSIKGFNGSTFLLHSIYEMKYFYFIELILLSIIIMLFAKLSKSVDFRGGYVYFIMASIMTVFGNYYLDINGFYAVILGVIICFLIKPSRHFEK